MKLLHVGCGQSTKAQSTDIFSRPEWEETRLDIDENVNPDIVSSITDMSVIEDDSFDAVSVAFGVRNFETLEKGLSEIYRVLKVNGVFVVLETSIPQNPFFKQGYFIYTKFFLPLIGKLFSRDKTAYEYLSDSAAKFPFGEDFNNILKKIGFIRVEALPQTFGVATIYTASKK